jgi:large repetitive protein
MRFTRVVFVLSLLALVLAPIAAAMRFTDASRVPPQGFTGSPYYHKVEVLAGGGAPPYQYHIISGSLPPGLSLTTEGKSGGDITGVPTRGGSYSFWVEATDCGADCGFALSKTQEQFTITILAGMNIVQQSLSPKATFLNQPYSFQLTTDNPAAAAAATWTVASGALPAGITLNSSSGLLSGTPTVSGDFTFRIRVNDGSRSDAETYTLSVVPQLQIGAVTGLAEVGVPYQAAPQATGGKPQYTWSVGGGTTLPAGLVIDPATGAISGIPTTAGTSAAQLAVTDTFGLTSTLNVQFNVASKLLITKKPLPAAKVGKKYSAFLRASGGVVPRTWIMLGGRPGLLPVGMKLNARTGLLSGTPRKAGTYRLRLQVTDKFGVHSAAGFVLKVRA